MSPKNDTDAAALFTQHSDRLYRTIVGKFGDHYLAEEACQFAWIQLLRVPPADTGYIFAWLTTVATNEALRIIRTTTDRETAAEFAPEPTDALGLDGEMEKRDIADALAQLKPQQQVALRLWSQGYTYEEIMETTGKTRTWVNRHIVEGKAALRRILDD